MCCAVDVACYRCVGCQEGQALLAAGGSARSCLSAIFIRSYSCAPESESQSHLPAGYYAAAQRGSSARNSRLKTRLLIYYCGPSYSYLVSLQLSEAEVNTHICTLPGCFCTQNQNKSSMHGGHISRNSSKSEAVSCSFFKCLKYLWTTFKILLHVHCNFSPLVCVTKLNISLGSSFSINRSLCQNK